MIARRFKKAVIPVAFAVAAALPVSASAQQMQTNDPGVCGTQEVPILTEGTLRVSQPDTMGRHDEGVLDFSAVRGSIVHMEGDLVLLRIDGVGHGNAAPNRAIAGDGWAVVRMPDGCSATDFEMGKPILAIGTPDGHGVLHAIEVTAAG